MSDKTEAAQKWAEAKSALESADQALALAKAEYAKCEDAEFHAWQELEGLAGRTSPKPERPRDVPTHTVSGWTAESTPMRHSLPVKPIG